MESIELSRPVLTQGRTDMLEKWLTEASSVRLCLMEKSSAGQYLLPPT